MFLLFTTQLHTLLTIFHWLHFAMPIYYHQWIMQQKQLKDSYIVRQVFQRWVIEHDMVRTRLPIHLLQHTCP